MTTRISLATYARSLAVLIAASLTPAAALAGANFAPAGTLEAAFAPDRGWRAPALAMGQSGRWGDVLDRRASEIANAKTACKGAQGKSAPACIAALWTSAMVRLGRADGADPVAL